MVPEPPPQELVARHRNWYTRTPLYIRVLIGVALGIAAGMTVKEFAPGLREFGKLFIQLLKALATPLILFAVLDAFLKTHIPAKKGATLVAISALNATVAILIGLGVANALRGGDHWKGKLDVISNEVKESQGTAGPLKKVETPPETTLDPMKNISSYVPKNLVDPFRENSVITVVLLAVLAGAALRSIKNRASPQHAPAVQAVEHVISVVFQVFSQILEWLIQVVPFAVFGVVAGEVAERGVQVLLILAIFLATILLGLFIHAVVYYSLLLWVAARQSPLKFYAGAKDAILTALSCGSSLATLPVTLRCLNDKLKISPGSARLAACVGTNLNHDGIILYEAAATIFISQALGYDLSASQQFTVALASVMAGIGIAGVPEAGLITLPLVLAAGGVKSEVVLTVVPLLLTVDWIIGRCRAATNVISDMIVATLLDKFHPDEAEKSKPQIEPVI